MLRGQHTHKVQRPTAARGQVRQVGLEPALHKPDCLHSTVQSGTVCNLPNEGSSRTHLGQELLLVVVFANNGYADEVQLGGLSWIHTGHQVCYQELRGLRHARCVGGLLGSAVKEAFSLRHAFESWTATPTLSVSILTSRGTDSRGDLPLVYCITITFAGGGWTITFAIDAQLQENTL